MTAFLGIRTLLAPQAMMETFGVSVTTFQGLDLLTSVLGSAILSLSLFVLLAAWWSWRDLVAGRTLGLLCAVTLWLVAASGWLLGGSTEILLLDGVRGTLLFLSGWLWRPET